ncbi:uncharacterized protein LOC126560770 [Anopheles maculipalpis]|uniref:uncharacterized protein LOC126560770 n=1 Tax=Anopheles maculipalpis TaxID=1496333 RepID=UPI002158DDBD|nr:uncharacterized protein LOC126560770 [Anopheles maculipalpis]
MKESESKACTSSSSNISFCEHYKNMLVEEIALVEHPAHGHYGKCSVIGRLSCTGDKLESLSVPDLPPALQLPDGTSSVELCLDNYCGSIREGSHVEITGILKYRNIYTGVTTDSGMLRSNLQCDDETKSKQRYSEMQTRYVPFIEVDHIRTVTRARELISCNLRLRKLAMCKRLNR